MAQEKTHPLRMLKKSVQQGRRRIEPGGGTDRTSWGRSPIQWILASGKTPPGFPPSKSFNRYVEDFGEPRTKRAGFFSILLTAKGLFGHGQFPFNNCADHGQSLRRGGFKP